jgi:hypothetical protein
MIDVRGRLLFPFPCAAGAAEHYPEIPVRIRVLQDVAYMHETLRLVDTLSPGHGIAIALKVSPWTAIHRIDVVLS